MRNKGKWCLVFLLFLGAVAVAQPVSMQGALEWDTMKLTAVLSLDLGSANIKLPAGRTLGETLIGSDYFQLVSPSILAIQADSSSTLEDLLNQGYMDLHQIEEIAHNARRMPPFLSPDLLSLSASYVIDLEDISTALISHSRPVEVRRTLNPVSVPVYTGLIIIADSPLPVHGMRSPALAVPCLFPRIWDSDMNLIYERNMLETGRKTMANYAPSRSIFQDTSSGLSPEITALVGQRPLRIIASGLYGTNPTDFIIDSEDALGIISSQENRRLLSQGRVLFILNDSQLKKSLGDG